MNAAWQLSHELCPGTSIDQACAITPSRYVSISISTPFSVARSRCLQLSREVCFALDVIRRASGRWPCLDQTQWPVVGQWSLKLIRRHSQLNGQRALEISTNPATPPQCQGRTSKNGLKSREGARLADVGWPQNNNSIFTTNIYSQSRVKSISQNPIIVFFPSSLAHALPSIA